MGWHFREQSWRANLKYKAKLASLLFRHHPSYYLALVEHFADTLGGRKSHETQAALTANGEPLPWYTYPAIAYLAQLDFSGSDVFEYGSGNSSRYWAQRARTVASVESDPAWFQVISLDLAPNQNLMLR